MGAESLHCRCCNTNVDISKVIAAREKNKKNTAKIRRKSKWGIEQQQQQQQQQEQEQEQEQKRLR